MRSINSVFTSPRLCASLLLLCIASAGAAERPNILFIMADQLAASALPATLLPVEEKPMRMMFLGMGTV